MSVSKWMWTEECDKGICINDCDRCDKAAYEETIRVAVYKNPPKKLKGEKDDKGRSN